MTAAIKSSKTQPQPANSLPYNNICYTAWLLIETRHLYVRLLNKQEELAAGLGNLSLKFFSISADKRLGGMNKEELRTM